jgi:hypothetical protein
VASDTPLVLIPGKRYITTENRVKHSRCYGWGMPRQKSLATCLFSRQRKENGGRRGLASGLLSCNPCCARLDC